MPGSRRERSLRPLAALLALATAPVAAQSPDSLLTTVLVVRHAERADGSTNADLSEAGQRRASELAAVARSYGVQAVYATEYCRTTQTAEPAALDLGLPLLIQPNGREGIDLESCAPPLAASWWLLEEHPDIASLARLVRTEQRGRAVLVVGHSNTVPQWVTALGAESPCPDPLPFDAAGRCWLPDADYHHLFVVTLQPDGGATARLEAYGAPSGDTDPGS